MGRDDITLVGVLGAIIVATTYAAFGATLETAPSRPNPTPVERHSVLPPAEAAHLDLLRRRWEYHIKESGLARNCLREKGEEIGWLMSPLLNGYYYGYLATHDRTWISRFVSCTDAWLRRGVVEPDGYMGWPKFDAAGNPVDDLKSYYADSLLGEAMALRPIVLLSAEILKDPALRGAYGEKAQSYIEVAKSIFDKWEKRGTWRRVDNGVVAVVLPFGIDQSTGRWTDNYRNRFDEHLGFSLQNNKQNLVASWMLAMYDATGELKYRDRAEQWFKVMKSRMLPGQKGTFRIWNYWQPAGSWDYRADGEPKHWIGVHPNAGYYAIDVEAIAAAYEHKLVFDNMDIAKLIKTASVENRSWPALAPYDDAVRQKLLFSLNPSGWAEISLVPWYLTLGVPSATSVPLHSK